MQIYQVTKPHGDIYRPDLLLQTSNECLYIVELTVEFESKEGKYAQLIREQSEHFKSVKFVNISMSCLGVFAKECSTFMEMLNDLGFEQSYKKYCIKRMTTIAIQTTYYIHVFCCRNKDWSDPELLTF